MKSTRILIAMSDIAATLAIRGRLQAVGFAAAGAAATGEEAVALARKLRPDLVLMDIRLAGAMGGVAAAAEVRRSLDLPVLFLVARSDDLALAGVIAAQPAGCLVEPFADRELGFAIELAVHRHREDLRARAGAGPPGQPAFLQTLMDALPTPVFYKGVDLRYLGCNEAYARILGRTAGELIGKTVYDIWPADLAAVYDEHDRKLLAGLAPLEYEGVAVQADGQRRNILYHKAVFAGPAGAPGGIIGVMEDITDRKLAETALREREARYRAVIETSADGFLLVDRGGRILEVNDSYVRMSGYSREELLRMTIADLEASESPADVAAHMERMIASGSDLFETRYRAKDGTVWQAQTNVTFWPFGGGQFFVFVLDIVRRKRSEALLRARIGLSALATTARGEDVLRAAAAEAALLTRSAAAFFCLLNLDEQALRPSALTAEAAAFLAAHPDPDSLWHRCARTAAADIAGVAAGGPACCVPVVRAGRVAAILCAAGRTSGYTQDDLEILSEIASMALDIEARRRAEEEIRRFVAISPVVLYALEERGGRLALTWVSENLQRITGWQASKTDEQWWVDNIHPDDRERVFASQPLPYRIAHQVQEFRFRRKDGPYILVRDEKLFVPGGDGRPAGVIGSWSDVTERARLEEELRHAQKMEAVGQLAGGIAHDFNNLLTVILGYCDVLLTRTPESDPRRALLGHVRRAGERASSLTSQLLAFSRRQVLEPRVVDLNESVNAIEKMLRRLIGENIALTTILSPSAAPVRVDPVQMDQVVLNLAVNARDAMPDGGRLTIETASVVLDAERCRLNPGSRPGPCTVLSIADTGCGITDEIKSRIFEPFFTTKRPGKGTGLGLATVFGIVAQSGGHIEVETEVGRGTTFRVYLPAVGPQRGDAAGGKPDPMPGRETILLVEDDRAVRDMTRVALESLGYAVEATAGGAEALALLERSWARLDLVLTDVVMPEMSGRELRDRVRASWPGLKVLLMSGYDEELADHGVAAGVDLLRKPFTIADLTVKLRQLLDG
jgi:two-component system, cell cycle sensor histidine kinase and response regulator CckA